MYAFFLSTLGISKNDENDKAKVLFSSRNKLKKIIYIYGNDN